MTKQSSADTTLERDRPAITGAMIEAGWSVLTFHGIDVGSPATVLSEVYMAMTQAQHLRASDADGTES